MKFFGSLQKKSLGILKKELFGGSVFSIILFLVMLWFTITASAAVAVYEKADSGQNLTRQTLVGEKWVEKIAVKSNLLYDAGGFPSLAVEFPIAHEGKWSIDISGNYNPISYGGGRLWKNWLVQPEIRYNFGQRRQSRRGVSFFAAAHLLGGQYNLQKTPILKKIYSELNGNRYQGSGIGGGLGFGVRFNFSGTVGMEIEAGAGYIYSRYDRYRCGKCGERVGNGSHNYFGLTKAAVNFLIRIGGPVKKKQVKNLLENDGIIRDTVLLTRTDTVFSKEILPGDTLIVLPAIRNAKMTVRLDFAVNSDRIDPARGENGPQLDSLSRFIERYVSDPTLRIHSIVLKGYSSIEGASAYNKALSERRAESMARYLEESRNELKGMITSEGMGEDWESLEFDNKDQIMKISDLDQRQKSLERIDGGRLFRHLLAERIPDTRRVECVIGYTEIENISK